MNHSQVLMDLLSIVNRLEKATAHDATEPRVGEIQEETQKTIEDTQLPPENDDDFKEAIEQLNSLKSEVNDRKLNDILERYKKAVTRKHRAWLWQQNYLDASLRDKERIWLELEEADKEATTLKEYLTQRIEQLLHC